MNRVHHGHSAAHLDRREPEALPLDDLLDSSVIQRSNISKRNPSDDSSTTSPSTCGKNDNSPQCGKPADTNNITLPVVLGVVYAFLSTVVADDALIRAIAFLW